MGGYNHYPWCTCGWCVKDIGYINNKYETNFKYNDYPNFKIETYESFTIPNIECKCCGNEIYFYQSPYGGKVFFNELGHPWEKHCCESECCSKERENIPYKVLYTSNATKRKTLWEKNGWIPAIFIREECYSVSLTKIIIKSMKDYKEYSFYIQSCIYYNIKEYLAINYRIIDNDFYEISFHSDKKYLLIVNKEPNFNDLKKFPNIRNTLKLIKNNNIKDIDLVKNFFKLLSSLDFENGAIVDITSTNTFKTLEQWCNFFSTTNGNEKLIDMFKILTQPAVINFNLKTKKDWNTLSKLTIYILNKKKFDETVARKNEIWRPKHLLLSIKNDKQTLELKVWQDDNDSIDYKKRVKTYLDSKAKSINSVKIAQIKQKEALKAKKKAMGLKVTERLSSDTMVEISYEILADTISQLLQNVTPSDKAKAKLKKVLESL